MWNRLFAPWNTRLGARVVMAATCQVAVHRRKPLPLLALQPGENEKPPSCILGQEDGFEVIDEKKSTLFYHKFDRFVADHQDVDAGVELGDIDDGGFVAVGRLLHDQLALEVVDADVACCSLY